MAEHNIEEHLENYIHFLNERNLDDLIEMLHDDYVEEYPQSGERIRGKKNARKVYENFKNLPRVKGYNLQTCGNMGIVEMLLDYPDGGIYNNCEIIEFKDGKIASVKAYFGHPFEAAEWRSEWVEIMGEPTSDEGYHSRPSRRA